MRGSCQDLTVKYGNLVALDHINLNIPKGQSVVLIGENGAGKSTLLRVLAGWMRPTNGRVAINDQDLVQRERQVRAWVKLVPDTPQFCSEKFPRESGAWPISLRPGPDRRFRGRKSAQDAGFRVT